MASFRLGPRAGRPRVATRLRLAQSQRVHALAELADGTLLAASRAGRSISTRGVVSSTCPAPTVTTPTTAGCRAATS